MDNIFLGDCLEILKTLPDQSVDAIVSDPPSGIAFMGKTWDKDKGGRAQWIDWMSKVAAECWRVIKPGGHALVWAIPRTSHWTMTAWEDGGWEPRDKVYHAFGNGFPKSLDVSKAIDKAAGAEREVVGSKLGRPGMAKDGRNQSFDSSVNSYGSGGSLSTDITAPATEAARQWQGWGTALKPAVEEWCLFRKPSPLTIAKTVQEWGTGALNVDGCRVASDPDVNDRKAKTREGPQVQGNAFGKFEGTGKAWSATQGRWPANLILSDDDETRGCFPETTSGNLAPHHKRGKNTNTYGESNGSPPSQNFGGDSGSAARFFKSISDTDPEDAETRRIFYCAKASKSDRDEGLEGFEEVYTLKEDCPEHIKKELKEWCNKAA